MIGTVFLIAFFIVSGIHLYASKKKDSELRAKSKVFIMLALLGWYCCSVDRISLVVVIALLTSWCGDVFLIPSGVKWFMLGGISFGISHLCFALTYAPNITFSELSPLVIIIISVAYLIAVILEFRSLKPYLMKELFYPMFAYLIVNGLMNSFAWFQMISNPCKATVITLIGAILFFISDAILFFVRFNDETRWKSHFPVMLTYSLGELLIVYGIILL